MLRPSILIILLRPIDQSPRMEYDKISSDIAKVRIALEQIPDIDLNLKGLINHGLNKRQGEINKNYGK